jgi:hypothetical protein
MEDFMPVSIHRIEYEPIIVFTYTDPFDSKDVENGNQETARLIAEIKGPVYRIENINALSLDFSAVVEGIGSATIPQMAGTVRDANARFIFVGHGPLFDMVVNSLSQEQYGGIKCPAFATVDEAIAYVRVTA